MLSVIRTALCEGRQRLHLACPRPSMSVPWTPVACTPEFASQKIQEGKLAKDFRPFSSSEEEMRYNQETLPLIPPVILSFSCLPPGEFISVPGRKNIPLLSTNKQIFPKLFTESDKPNGKCDGYEKEEENAFFYLQTRIM